MKKLFLLLLLLTIPYQSIAETATSGNLLPNQGDGQANWQNQTDGLSPDKVGSAISGQVDTTGVHTFFQNEFECGGNCTIRSAGSLEGLNIITENAQSHTTTTQSLDGGVRLDAITEVQNCEWVGSSFQCGQASRGGGSRDTFSTTVKILDENNEVLATVTQIRNNDSGYYSNTHTYQDSVTHTGEGARKWDWEWEGIDGSSTNNNSLIGPNLLGASLQATLLDINYSPISAEELSNINTAVEEIEEVAEAIEENFETLNIEEELENFGTLTLLEEPTFNTEIEIEEELAIETIELEMQEVEVKQVELEMFKELFVENFKAILEEENLVEEFEEILMEEAITEEQFFEETVSMIVETLEEPMPMPTENVSTITEEPTIEPTAMEEEVVQTEEPVALEEKPVMEETSTAMEESSIEENNQPEEVTTSENETVTTEENATEETVASENEQPTTEENNTNATETTAQSEETSNEGNTETETETVSNESNMDETTTSEGTPTQEGGEEVVVDEDTSVSESSTQVSDIGAKIEKIIAKVEAKLKKVSDRVRAIQVVTLKGMQMNAPNLSAYNKPIYQNQKMIGVPNPNFFDTINILEQQQIYADASLVAYTGNDPIAVKQGILTDIHNEKLRVLQELKELKRGS